MLTHSRPIIDPFLKLAVQTYQTQLKHNLNMRNPQTARMKPGGKPPEPIRPIEYVGEVVPRMRRAINRRLDDEEEKQVRSQLILNSPPTPILRPRNPFVTPFWLRNIRQERDSVRATTPESPTQLASSPPTTPELTRGQSSVASTPPVTPVTPKTKRKTELEVLLEGVVPTVGKRKRTPTPTKGVHASKRLCRRNKGSSE
ncbi:hypothetical protein VNI00_016998 [Paramarasmius palmivorus]|uniref:Uncharacterized protein n=1 Tax=Paramarasmius palmivorus TaxID=297713 RepID=A0AAW0BAV4_9AGAR